MHMQNTPNLQAISPSRPQVGPLQVPRSKNITSPNMAPHSVLRPLLTKGPNSERPQQPRSSTSVSLQKRHQKEHNWDSVLFHWGYTGRQRGKGGKLARSPKKNRSAISFESLEKIFKIYFSCTVTEGCSGHNPAPSTSHPATYCGFHDHLREMGDL